MDFPAPGHLGLKTTVCNAHIDWLSGCTTQVVAVINVWPVTHTATVMIFPFDPTLLQGIFNTA